VAACIPNWIGRCLSTLAVIVPYPRALQHYSGNVCSYYRLLIGNKKNLYALNEKTKQVKTALRAEHSLHACRLVFIAVVYEGVVASPSGFRSKPERLNAWNRIAQRSRVRCACWPSRKLQVTVPILSSLLNDTTLWFAHRTTTQVWRKLALRLQPHGFVDLLAKCAGSPEPFIT
jgi:hypothetical protein